MDNEKQQSIKIIWYNFYYSLYANYKGYDFVIYKNTFILRICILKNHSWSTVMESEFKDIESAKETAYSFCERL